MILSKGLGWLANAGPSEARQGLTLWLVVATAFMLFPFKFDYQGPWKVANGVERLSEGGVRFQGPARLQTMKPPVWVDAAVASGYLDIELELRTTASGQSGPARILTLSDGPLRRNFMVAQKGKNLIVRARREGADENGAPPLKVDNVFDEPRDLKIEVLFRDRLIQIFVNNKPVYRETLKSSSLDLWDPSFTLALGNEVDGARGWNGDLAVARATVKGAKYDLLTAPDMDEPEKFWHVPQQTRRLFIVDTSHFFIVEPFHILFFMPFGALLWMRKRRRSASAIVKIALAGLLLGALFQFTKVAFAGRHPSLIHVPFDMLGTALGALLSPMMIRWSQRRSEPTP